MSGKTFVFTNMNNGSVVEIELSAKQVQLAEQLGITPIGYAKELYKAVYPPVEPIVVEKENME